MGEIGGDGKFDRVDVEDSILAVRERSMANGSLEWFPPAQQDGNLHRILQFKRNSTRKVVFICPPMVEFGWIMRAGVSGPPPGLFLVLQALPAAFHDFLG